VAASLEICRRGIYKYIKGSKVLPELTEKDIVTMSNMVFVKDHVRD